MLRRSLFMTLVTRAGNDTSLKQNIFVQAISDPKDRLRGGYESPMHSWSCVARLPRKLLRQVDRSSLIAQHQSGRWIRNSGIRYDGS